MKTNTDPRPYEEWRTESENREKDAANVLGYHLIGHCRDEAMATLSSDVTTETKTKVEKAVDIALHNVVDMLEGFWKLEAGSKYNLELVLRVRVHDANGNEVEAIDISPCKLELPIGYWKWAQEREFR